MAQQGLIVDAIDRDESAIRSTKRICKGLPVNIRKENMENFLITPEKYSVIFSWNSLPFLHQEIARAMFKKIKLGLKVNGLFVFQVFGPEDGWSRHEGMAFFTKEEIVKMFEDTQSLELSERKEIGELAAGGEKFWHFIRGIVKKI
jgi:hypothetical protein